MRWELLKVEQVDQLDCKFIFFFSPFHVLMASFSQDSCLVCSAQHKVGCWKAGPVSH